MQDNVNILPDVDNFSPSLKMFLKMEFVDTNVILDNTLDETSYLISLPLFVRTYKTGIIEIMISSVLSLVTLPLLSVVCFREGRIRRVSVIKKALEKETNPSIQLMRFKSSIWCLLQLKCYILL